MQSIRRMRTPSEEEVRIFFRGNLYEGMKKLLYRREA